MNYFEPCLGSKCAFSEPDRFKMIRTNKGGGIGKMDDNQKKFLRNEFLTMSVNGALGRSGTYLKSAPDSARENFKSALRTKVHELAKKYTFTVTEEEHVSNIIELSDRLTSRFSSCLINGRFRIGIAQKALNLYLKYLWCAGAILMPPHCPFDRKVIRYLRPECANLNWTSIDAIDDYERLVEAAKNKAEGKPLSQWELEIWNKSSKLLGQIQCQWMPPKDMILDGYLNFLSDKDKNENLLPNYEIKVYKNYEYDKTGRPKRGDKIVLKDKAGNYYKHL